MTNQQGSRPADRAGAMEGGVTDARDATDAIDVAGGSRRGPCACLPESETVAGWPACATCGLPQAPGKDFCGFCGRRWRTEERGGHAETAAPTDRPADARD